MSSALPTKVIAGVEVVDTPLVRAAQDFARQHLDDLAYNHVMRSWIFGVIIYQHFRDKGEFPAIDLEAHAVSAILHDLGWDKTGELVSADKRFEVDGAIAARNFIEEQQKSGKTANWDHHRLQLVWDAIALHSTPAIAAYKEPVVRLCSFGTSVDFQGPDSDRTRTVTWEEFYALNNVFPRHDLAGGVRKVMCGLCRAKPATTYDTFVMGWGRKYVKGYQEKEKLMYEIVERALP
ncbi:hypothetical protein NW759_016941 [Fusarium solani]|uniref:HD domain-containing protein n=1 Tax=Fusarium falciforme TaxID=195108 RepID=A0A9W8QQD1_9HYPO|nr:hypothetical protein NW755_014685 [Fusarium falciforme]KAJ4186367.1 hypothetical protein NW759_016941 [Fusarium solani]